MNIGSIIRSTGSALKKNAPSILFGVGIGGAGVAVVRACKKTSENHEALTEAKAAVVEVIEKKEEVLAEGGVTAKEYRTLTVQTYWNLVKTYAKVYAEPAAEFVAAGICLYFSYKIPAKRLVASEALAMELSDELSKLQENLKKHCTPEEYAEIVTDAEKVATKEKVKNEETGRMVSATREYDIVPEDYEGSLNVRVFGPGNPLFDCQMTGGCSNYHYTILTQEEAKWHDILMDRARKAKNGVGHVFLNEICDYYSLHTSAYGHDHGFMCDLNNPDDMFCGHPVNFGIMKAYRKVESRKPRGNSAYLGTEEIYILSFDVIPHAIHDIGWAPEG